MTRSPSLLLALTFCACQFAPTDPGQVLARVRADFKGAGGLDIATLKRQEERYDLLQTWHEEGRLTSADDLLYASAALVTSDRREDLTLSRTLALAVAELGDARGFTVQAEATDKLLMKQGKPQCFGTQFVFEPVLGRWKLYAVDPLTTDEERRAMGIPPLVKLMERVEWLNSAPSFRQLGTLRDPESGPQIVD